MTNYGKTIDVRYSPSGEITALEETRHQEQAVREAYEPFSLLRYKEVGGKVYQVNMLEASLQLPDAGNILRQDIRYLAFSRFAAMPRDFEVFTYMQDSNKPEETYLRDAAVGVIPRANSGTEAPHMITDFEGSANIKNFLHRGIFDFPMDLLRFDQIGKIRQIANEMGRAAGMTVMDRVYAYLTTTTNYTRNSTTGDNNIGANQQTLTFSADGLRTAMAIITTAKDRKSGQYLMYSPDTIICGPLMEVPVKMLLTTMALSRVHGATTAEAIGTGSVNVLGDGRISRIVVSPVFDASYGWALCDSRAQGFTMQTVEPFDIFEQPQNPTSDRWFATDSLAYLVKGYFGVGFTDDRAWFYSNSSTDATVS